ncbi:MAG: hypothetical protein KF708_24140 [Pirellulales bacterium]|nr:hypothetical protein [Pirellulales bacterium]
MSVWAAHAADGALQAFAAGLVGKNRVRRTLPAYRQTANAFVPFVVVSFALLFGVQAMKVFVHRNQGEVRPVLQQFAEQEFGAALAKWTHRLPRVDIFVRDVNGPRGGLDQLVRAVIPLPHHGTVHVQERHHPLPFVLTRVAQKAQRAVERVLLRKKGHAIRQQQRAARFVDSHRRAAVGAIQATESPAEADT